VDLATARARPPAYIADDASGAGAAGSGHEFGGKLQLNRQLFQHNGSGQGKPSLPNYVLNQFDPSLPLHLDIREVLREHWRPAAAICHTARTGGERSPGRRMTVMDYAPNSTVAEDFGSLAGWVKSNRQPRAARIAAYAGARDDSHGPLAGYRGRENFFTKLLRLIFLLAAAAAFCFLAILPLTWPHRRCWTVEPADGPGDGAQFGFLPGHADLMMMSMFCTFRYGYWRIMQVVQFFKIRRVTGARWTHFSSCAAAGEAYAFLILFLGYFQTIWPLRRAPVSLPDDTDEWPHVDVLIPTYNERWRCALYGAGAMNMDCRGQIHIYILDDGGARSLSGSRSRPESATRRGTTTLMPRRQHQCRAEDASSPLWRSSTAITCRRGVFCR